MKSVTLEKFNAVPLMLYKYLIVSESRFVSFFKSTNLSKTFSYCLRSLRYLKEQVFLLELSHKKHNNFPEIFCISCDYDQKEVPLQSKLNSLTN